MNLLLWTVHPTVQEHGRLLKQIRNWGFDGVEFPIAAVTEAEARELARLADGLGLGRTTIQGLNAAHADPAAADPALRKAAVETLKQAVDKTRLVGAEILAGPIFQGLGRFSGAAPNPDEWKHAVDVIREVGEYAATMHVRLALEPLNRFEMYLVNTIADGARFCRETELPNVGLLADTHHANIEEYDPAKTWREASAHIFHVHISENNRGVPGRGHAAGQAMFDALRAGGYDDWLTIEAFGQKVQPLVPRLHIWRAYFDDESEVATEGLRYIRESWRRARRA